jgi:hypothetical protein
MLFLAPNKKAVSAEVDRLIPEHHAVQTASYDDTHREETVLIPSELQLMSIDG